MPQAKSYMNSDDIIASVKRRISFPVSQNTFTNDDILAFANEEFMTSQVPSILQYHEEYYVYNVVTPLQDNLSRYPIPPRAIGMKLRDVKWTDQAGNFFDMTRIADSDKGFFQKSIGANQQIHKFYIEGNDIVLTPSVVTGPTGAINFFILIRPNQLVDTTRAAFIKNFNQTIKLVSVAGGDSVYVNGTAYTAKVSPTLTNDFQLGASDSITATNLAAFLNGLAGTTIPDLISATATSNTVLFRFSDQRYSFSFNNKVFDAFSEVNIIPNTFSIPSHGLANNTQISFSQPLAATLPTGVLSNVNYYVINASTNTFQISATLAGPVVIIAGTGSGLCYIITELSSPSFQIPLTTSGIEFISLMSTYTSPITNVTEPLFVTGALVDFLQTNPGHKIYNFDVKVPTNGISGNIVTFNNVDIPTTMVVGDYMCLANEAIIPYLPPDLHNVLAERTAARILSAQGDAQGLAASMEKIKEMEFKTGEIIDNRVEDAPKKINARHSLLHYAKSSYRRRY